MSDVTRLLDAAAAGDRQAAAALLPLVYDELRKLAAARLVHEAYLRLVGGNGFDGRGHFFAAAAEAMRRILIDQARRKQADKHGGGWHRLDVLDAELAVDSTGDDLLAVNEALTRL